MDAIERVLSRPTAKPYRSHQIPRDIPYINENGHVDFAPNDVENPKDWSKARRWYVTLIAILLVMNATFASSAPSGCLPVSEDRVYSGRSCGLLLDYTMSGD